MKRIQTLCSFLMPTTTFADVGCDHGFCTLYMLEHRLCERAVITDVSSKSLAKAEKLLSDHIERGVVTSVCCDGLQGVDRNIQEVLIAGMGGEEIVKILTEGFIPPLFVLQPMKNADKLRRFLLAHGCELTRDDVFFAEGKYYFCLAGKRTGRSVPYSEAQSAFGRDSLHNPVLRDYLQAEIEKKERYLLSPLSLKSRADVEAEIAFFREVLTDECD